MPIVPRYDRPQVRETAAPTARVQNAATSESFGGGESSQRLGQAFQESANLAGQIFQKEKEKADDIATQDAWNRAVQAKNKLLYDPQNGAVTRKGKNALGLPEEYGEAYDKELNSIEEGLSSDQKAIFSRIRGKERTEFDGGLQRHMSAEIQSYEMDTRKATIKTAQDEAVLNMHDPDKVAQSLSLVTGAAAEIAQAQGFDETQTKALVDGELSRTHTSIARRMLSNGDDMKAKAYFDANREAFSADDVAQLEGALEEGSLRGNSQRISDSIARKHGSLGAAVAAAKEATKDDPKLRDATIDRIKGEFAMKDAAKRDMEERDFIEASNVIERGGTYDEIDPNVVARMPLSHRTALRSYAQGKDTQTDPATYMDLKLRAARPESRKEFLSLDMMHYQSMLSRSDWKEMVDLQASIGGKVNDPTAEKKLNGFLTAQEYVNTSMDELGIKEKNERGSFAMRANQAVEVFKRQNDGKEPSSDDMHAIVGEIVRKVPVEGRFWGTNEKALYKLTENDELSVKSSEIPARDRSEIIASLKRKNMSATEDAILRVYKARFLNGARRAD